MASAKRRPSWPPWGATAPPPAERSPHSRSIRFEQSTFSTHYFPGGPRPPLGRGGRHWIDFRSFFFKFPVGIELKASPSKRMGSPTSVGRWSPWNKRKATRSSTALENERAPRPIGVAPVVKPKKKQLKTSDSFIGSVIQSTWWLRFWGRFYFVIFPSRFHWMLLIEYWLFHQLVGSVFFSVRGFIVSKIPSRQVSFKSTRHLNSFLF